MINLHLGFQNTLKSVFEDVYAFIRVSEPFKIPARHEW